MSSGGGVNGEEYVVQKNVHVLFDKLATALIQQQPDDPLEFLENEVRKLREEKSGGAAKGEASTQASKQEASNAKEESSPRKLVGERRYPSALDEAALTIVVFGASGDLARKKTYPALFALYCKGLLPMHAKILGYARSKMEDKEFKDSISQHFRKDYEAEARGKFLELCSYVSGSYDESEVFAGALTPALEEAEKGYEVANRLHYLALPPSVFMPVATNIQKHAMSGTGWTRIIIEKPFGRDSESSNKLSGQMSKLFQEEVIYRIDHYLGKEMVQNLVALRFANKVFSHTWSNQTVSSVIITFKEPFGTEGRGGYFDKFGIIRDIMQNHLTQVLALVAMEKPKSTNAEDIRDEKVHLLRAVEPVKLENTVIGQYTKGKDGKGESYLDDEGVPNDSICPTYCASAIFVNNDRWAGVPFIMKAGKALNDRKAEVRIQFKPEVQPFNSPPANELVIRIQPNEALYLKANAKVPGLRHDMQQLELDLSYKQRFVNLDLPDAYESLIYEATIGNAANFVRSDELAAAWEIFTPLLHQLEREKVAPIEYPFGSRGPPEADALVKKFGYKYSENYTWAKEGVTLTSPLRSSSPKGRKYEPENRQKMEKGEKM